ncbi:MAG: 50S ribosomal protein L17 [Candidatus Margulisbacteria bacterium]|jgi:large subunit ribosomal protein L17|nr:50S ribosomal protein L17 [Candidatus Margulisiibacteriota bacterium]
MRHKYGYNKLHKPTDQRLAMLKSMAVSLFRYERIETTEARAKELRKMVDGIITLVKKGDLSSRRRVINLLLSDKELVKRLYAGKDRFKTRNSGYSRIIQSGARRGDAAKMVLLELVDAA